MNQVNMIVIQWNNALWKHCSHHIHGCHNCVSTCWSHMVMGCYCSYGTCIVFKEIWAHNPKPHWPTYSPSGKYFWPLVTWIISVMHSNKLNMSTEYNVTTLLVEKMFTNYNSSDIFLKTSHTQHKMDKQATYFMWLSHHQALIKNIKKVLDTVVFLIQAWWRLNQLKHIACFILSYMRNICHWKHSRDVSHLKTKIHHF